MHSSVGFPMRPSPLPVLPASFVDDPVNNLGSNLLKVTIGLAALVFIIMLQAHHNHDPGATTYQPRVGQGYNPDDPGC